MPTQPENYQRRASTGGGEGDAVSPSGDIESYINTEISQFLTLHTDPVTLPPDAESRGDRGTFFDISDVMKYLDQGGLLITDENNNPVVNPLVHVHYRYDEFFEDNIYEVYIDDVS